MKVLEKPGPVGAPGTCRNYSVILVIHLQALHRGCCEDFLHELQSKSLKVLQLN